MYVQKMFFLDALLNSCNFPLRGRIMQQALKPTDPITDPSWPRVLSEHSPAWVPRGLPAKTAAYYVGFSVTSFRAHVAPQVPAVRISPGRLVWLREDLDRWLDGRRGSLPAPENLDPFLEI